MVESRTACTCLPQDAPSLPQRSTRALSSTADKGPPPLHAHRTTALERAQTGPGAVGNGLGAVDRSRWLPIGVVLQIAQRRRLRDCQWLVRVAHERQRSRHNIARLPKHRTWFKLSESQRSSDTVRRARTASRHPRRSCNCHPGRARLSSCSSDAASN